MIKKCKRCGKEYSEHVRSLEDIGKFLTEDHQKFDCDKIIEGQKEKIKTPEERLIDSLKDIIYDIENNIN